MIREYHRGRHPSAARVLDSEQLLEEEPHIQFSGEEAYGRYLDLHELYNDYINSKFGKQIDYSAYLEVFSQPQRIPSSKLQATRQYREYLRKLTGYLVYFLERIEPLRDLDRLFSKVITEFEEQWVNGKVDERKDDAQENTSINLDYYSTIEELVELGPEKLKKALVALGLKAGGTVQQRAERLFLTKHTPLENLDKRHFAKGARRPEQNNVKHQNDDLKQIARMEVKLEKLCEILSEKIIQTRKNVERKQGLTSKEIEAEMEDVRGRRHVADMEIDDENRQVYNPLKFPMGWDGKPISVWLYKLHGLGQEFKCEICGNHSYRGRRDYEQHFKEFRHLYGMHRLGIPNSKSFYEITSIEEVQRLWETIKEKQEANEWHPDSEEEFEDEEGNVYNKKTYDDLKRQGLI
ncbi:putative transcription factor C2H2 family [Helianthus annuus]|nr:putative transcription factor C2H2 family [Helianthus annuus]